MHLHQSLLPTVLLTVVCAGASAGSAFNGLPSDSTQIDVKAYYQVTWDEHVFDLPVMAVSSSYRRSQVGAGVKYDPKQPRLVELFGTYVPASTLTFTAGQFRTPAGEDIPRAELTLFSATPLSLVVPNVYDRGVMATLTTTHTSVMIASVNGEGIANPIVDSESDFVMRGALHFGPAQASAGQQIHSQRRYGFATITIVDPNLTVTYSVGQRRDLRSRASDLTIIGNWSTWRLGVQYASFRQDFHRQYGVINVRVRQRLLATSFALENQLGDLNRIRLECFPQQDDQVEWRVTFQQGLLVQR